MNYEYRIWQNNFNINFKIKFNLNLPIFVDNKNQNDPGSEWCSLGLNKWEHYLMKNVFIGGYFLTM